MFLIVAVRVWPIGSCYAGCVRAAASVLTGLLASGCYLAHAGTALDDAGRADGGSPPRPDAGARPDAGPPPVVECAVSIGFCAPVHDAPIQLFDAQTQSPELVWGPDRLLLAFWAPEDGPASGPHLLHLDLEGRVLEDVPLRRGYNETRLAWNPRIGQGLFSAESGLLWIGPDGHPTEELWLSPDPRFRGTFDVGPTEDGFAVVLSGRGMATQLGTSRAPGEVDWVEGPLAAAGPAVADAWTGELRAVAGGLLLRHDGVAWDPPIDGVPGGDFQPTDVLTLDGSLYTLHYHYGDGGRVLRRWTLAGELLGEAVIGTPEHTGSARLLAHERRLFAISTHLRPGAPIVLAEIDPRTLAVDRELFEVAPPPATVPYNRHSIAVTETPRGIAVVWTEGPIGSGNMRPFLRLYECCVTE